MAAFTVAIPVLIMALQWTFLRESGGSRTLLVTAVDLLTALGVLTGLYGCLLIRHGIGTGWPGARDTLLILGPPALVWALTLWLPGAAVTGGVPLWIAANILAPLVAGSSRRWVFAAGLVLFGVHWWAGQLITGVDVVGPRADPQLVSVLFFAAMTPLIYLFSAWWWNIVVELDAARRYAAQLAVARERLRFASDLHDIQGHHLQVIALKAELAERLMDAGQPDPARANIHEVRSLARTALEETRSLVRDLREVSLEEEIANAKDVLEAAGAAVRLSAIHVQDPAARTLLGLVVREGATNILRHASCATEVSIVLDAAGGGPRLVMTNDGVEDPGGTADGTGAPGAAGPASGTGLSGLNRRFEASGGSVTGRRDGGTYVLEARLPALPGGSAVEQGPTAAHEREQSA